MVRKQLIIGNRKIFKCPGNSKKVFAPKYKIIILLLAILVIYGGSYITLDVIEANNTFCISDSIRDSRFERGRKRALKSFSKAMPIFTPHHNVLSILPSHSSFGILGVDQ